MTDQAHDPELEDDADRADHSGHEPGAGHNVIGISREDFNKWVARHANAEADCETANVKRRKVRKEMRAAGIALTEFDAMRKLAELPEDEQAVKIQNSRYYLEYFGSRLGTQMSLHFDEPADPFGTEASVPDPKIAELAEGRGFQSGLTGKGDNPHEGNTLAFQAWVKGNNEGQDQRRQALAMGGK